MTALGTARRGAAFATIFVVDLWGAAATAQGAPPAPAGEPSPPPTATPAQDPEASPPRAARAACIPGSQDPCPCPSGTTGLKTCKPNGDEHYPCVCPQTQPSPPEPVPATTSTGATPAPAADSAGASTTQLPPAVEHSELVTEPREDVVNAGFVTFASGYFLAVLGTSTGLIVGAALEANGNGACADNVAYGYIPIVGPVLIGALWPNYSKYYDSGVSASCSGWRAPLLVFGTIDAAMQVGGLVTAIVGFAWEREVTIGGNTPLHVGVLPKVGGAQTGLDLYVRGF